MLVKPSQATLTGGIGSFGQTLKRRLPELSEERIEDLVSQLRDHRIVNLGSLKTAMTAHGAEDMTHGLTPFGQRFVRYIQGAAG